jgi:histidinol-phosphate aminotransferase
MSLTRRSLLAGFGAAFVVRPDVDARRGPLRLDRNVNAYGPSAAAVEAMRDAVQNGAHRYPDGDVEALQRRLATLHGVAAGAIVVGAGSLDIIRAAIAAFAGNGGTMVAATPTFERLAGCAADAGTSVTAVPLRRDYSHDLHAMLARTSAGTGLVYICNPNTPMGTLTRRHDLEAFVRALPKTAVVLVDEAYHHYATESLDYVSLLDRPLDDPRVIVTRTFSKIHGLAGVRVGYGVAPPAITARVLAARQSLENVSVAAARGAAAALEDREHVRDSLVRNGDDKQEFFNQALSRGLRPIDTLTNFVMFNTARPAADVVAHFRTHDVVISGAIPGFDTFVRVALGAPADMREFWRVWDLMGGAHAH